MREKKYTVIGVMSGTSMDGLDIACCHLALKKGKWTSRISYAVTIPFPELLKKKLIRAYSGSAADLALAHHSFGTFTGIKVSAFMRRYRIRRVDLIASHGHTIFHQPQNGFTTQIGDGAAIAFHTGCPVVCDFRSMDVAHGGQGAPLVPMADTLLFSDYDFCLNLGGIANLSASRNGKRIAFDICPANLALNRLANEAGKPYDSKGQMAGSGKITPHLLNQLNRLAYYRKPFPKSLGKEWVDAAFFPILDTYPASTADKLRTVCIHIADQIKRSCNKIKSSPGKMLITGGGTFNTFLIKAISAAVDQQVIIPDPVLIKYKEALAFALLGTLRMRNEINCLPSVTGAAAATAGGAVYIPTAEKGEYR